MNKLPWFTHDHDAHDDAFIQRAMDRFAHFGYSSFFIMLELIHRDGTGGVLRISRSRLCQKLRSRWTQVRLYLNFCRTSGKLNFTLIGDEVELQNKKFIERQRYLKSKAGSMQVESESNFSYSNKEKEIEKDVITDHMCEWYSKADGPCDQERAPKSKYCYHHKIKAGLKFEKPIKGLPELKRMP